MNLGRVIGTIWATRRHPGLEGTTMQLVQPLTCELKPNGDPRLDIMRSIYQRARQVIWLNPESRRAWGTGDSEMFRYLSACHFSAECNNLKQLERVVDQLLKSTR